jgi:FkbM family methyltransferase
MIKNLLSTEQRTTIERWCRDRARAAQMPDGTTLCRVLGEYPMVVSLDDLSIAPHLVLDGYWEMWLTICLARRLKVGWKCIDVGANVGYYTLLMALVTDGEVEAWEPMLDLHRSLASTIQLNGLGGRVTQKLWAASDIAAEAKLYRKPRDYGGGSMQREDLRAREYDVHMARLDRGTALTRVDFVKIDAEGLEPEIWAGMEDLFARGEPLAMLMEWTPKKYADPNGLLDAIQREGFKVSLVDGAGALQKPVGDITELDGHTDLWLER